jgi:hypothetical protein
MSASKTWKAKTDPLFRGDAAHGVAVPVPDADRSLVRHLLQLESMGQPSPYLSASESEEVAQRFARDEGWVYQAKVPEWDAHKVRHVPFKELLQLLRGNGKGDARWHSSAEVFEAACNVKRDFEHLADFGSIEPQSSEHSQLTARTLFQRRRGKP